jgi:hypothetical protein
MGILFNLVAGILYMIAYLTGFTYVEVNIIVYYIIIPITWIIMLDAIFKFHYLKIATLLIGLIASFFVKDFTGLCVWAFQKSVLLLNLPHSVKVDGITATQIPIADIMGPTYVTNSLIICVLVPTLIYAILTYFLIKRRIRVKIL